MGNLHGRRRAIRRCGAARVTPGRRVTALREGRDRSAAPGPRLSPTGILALQRAVGNRAVARLVAKQVQRAPAKRGRSGPLADQAPSWFRPTAGAMIARIGFRTNESRLDLLDRRVLDQLRAYLDGPLKRRHGIRVLFEGFADARGDKQHNQRLSDRRAKRVKDYVGDFNKSPFYGAVAVGKGDARSRAWRRKGRVVRATDRSVEITTDYRPPRPPRVLTPAEQLQIRQLESQIAEQRKKIKRVELRIKNLQTHISPTNDRKQSAILWILSLLGKVLARGQSDPYAPAGLDEALEKQYDEKMKEGIPDRIEKLGNELKGHKRRIEQLEERIRRIRDSKTR